MRFELHRRVRVPRFAAPIFGVLVAALLLRLDGVGFGLPALYDPDEPIFVLTALKLLRDHSLNPQWFGHPGTTTIYALAGVEAANFLIGQASGRFSDAQAFAREVYADPSVAFLPARLFIVALGVASVGLTFWVGWRASGYRVGLLAAALLAINPLSIRYSQIVRTDMHATVFILLILLSAVAIVKRARTRDYVLAGMWLGFACATKWPAAAAVAAPLAAGVWRILGGADDRLLVVRQLIIMALAAVVSLFVASPYLFLDYRQVLQDLEGELRASHVGASGHGLVDNLAWYLTAVLKTAFGWPALILAAAGVIAGARRSAALGVALPPTLIIFVLMISAQALIWERWMVPMLPLIAIMIAVAVDGAARSAAIRWGRRAKWGIGGAALLAAAAPAISTAHAQSAERRADTRALASAWLRRHAAPGSAVTVEHLAFDLLSTDWRFRFPIGDEGCVDVREILNAQIRYATIGKWRGDRAVVDLGTVDSSKLVTCGGDWAILVNYDRYLAEPAQFGQEIANYERLISGGEIAASFLPEAGKVGGPIVRIVRFPPRRVGTPSCDNCGEMAPFVSTYRTLCQAPIAEFRAILLQREEHGPASCAGEGR